MAGVKGQYSWNTGNGEDERGKARELASQRSSPLRASDLWSSIWSVLRKTRRLGAELTPSGFLVKGPSP